MGVGMFECFSNETCIPFYIDLFINKMELCDFEYIFRFNEFDGVILKKIFFRIIFFVDN